MKTTYTKSQIARIMNDQDLKRVESAIWVLDKRKREADQIRRKRAHKRKMARDLEIEAGFDCYLAHKESERLAAY